MNTYVIAVFKLDIVGTACQISCNSCYRVICIHYAHVIAIPYRVSVSTDHADNAAYRSPAGNIDLAVAIGDLDVTNRSPCQSRYLAVAYDHTVFKAQILDIGAAGIAE